MITVSAPGKLLIMGDHAVVYGQPCLVTAIDHRLRDSVEKIDTDQPVIHAPQVSNTKFIDEVLAQAKSHWRLPALSVSITTENGFSDIKGLGSSSAVVVALWKALSIFMNRPLSDKELFDCAYKTVLAVQSVGSGFDVAAAVYGGLVEFTAGAKTVVPISVPNLPIVIGYTGVPADTATIVKEVAQKYEREQAKVGKIFAAIGALVHQAQEQMIAGDWERVGTLMNFNQDYLRDLGVSSQKLEDLISAAKTAGAYGAKLSGAGRGDCMISLVPEAKRSAVEQAIVGAGGKVIRAYPNAPGVHAETTDNQQELFVVVDKSDTIVGYHTRYECHHDATLIHRGVNALIFDDTGRVLLQKRSMTKDTSPGLWSTSVGGHVGKGESYEGAIKRELQEELGIDIPVVAVHKFMFSYPHETEMETLFTARSNGPFHPDPEEVDSVVFISRNELPRKLLSGEIQLTQLAQHALQLVGFL